MHQGHLQGHQTPSLQSIVPKGGGSRICQLSSCATPTSCPGCREQASVGLPPPSPAPSTTPDLMRSCVPPCTEPPLPAAQTHQHVPSAVPAPRQCSKTPCACGPAPSSALHPFSPRCLSGSSLGEGTPAPRISELSTSPALLWALMSFLLHKPLLPKLRRLGLRHRPSVRHNADTSQYFQSLVSGSLSQTSRLVAPG